jgi:hypothetical protein
LLVVVVVVEVVEVLVVLVGKELSFVKGVGLRWTHCVE